MSEYKNQLMDLGILGVGDSLIIDSKRVFVHSLDTHKSLTWRCSNRRTNDFVRSMEVSESPTLGTTTKYVAERHIRWELSCKKIKKEQKLQFKEVVYKNKLYTVMMESDLYVILRDESMDKYMNADKDIRNDDFIIKKDFISLSNGTIVFIDDSYIIIFVDDDYIKGFDALIEGEYGVNELNDLVKSRGIELATEDLTVWMVEHKIDETLSDDFINEVANICIQTVISIEEK